MDNIKRLSEISNFMNIHLSDEMKQKFSRYKEMLKEWNEKINITTITDDDEIDIKHFADSLSPILTGKLDGNKSLIDIGTGGGFPGIPLKIYNSALEVTLLDSLNKRIVFLAEVVKELKLDRVELIHGRAEEIGLTTQYREKYDICISRAVASLDTLSEYCIPFVKPGGYFISMKGPSVDGEVDSSKKAIKTLGGIVEDIKYINLPCSDITHSLVIIKKITSTPDKYPRGAGKPKKTPIK